ncbi:MAG: 16S rRNA (guanine(527)-N(7))-methyltransferase RsmG [Flavobacteriales bacterium]|nr:16S rRNA (guanine(527)-N(7))-methyltransferase RsmG [Flavobacteriales bacterium]
MDEILKYFPNLTEEQVEQYICMGELYAHWNERINVISRKDMEYFYTRHVLHSMAIARVESFPDGAKVLDVGTGGGFPGVPLAVLFPKVHFTLVDSIGKKTKVAKAVSDELGLKNVTVINARVENVNEKFDYVVSRAVTAMDAFVPWVKGKFSNEKIDKKAGGILYLKGGELSDELKKFPKAQVFNISDFFCEEFFTTKRVVYLPIC